MLLSILSSMQANALTLRPASQRDTALEALRGLAALVVVFWHITLGLAPARSGLFTTMDPEAALDGEIWFGLLNGPAAVTFFFVLSGFVLTRRSFVEQSAARVPQGMLKRWPRLAGPVTISCMFSWVLARVHAYRYAQAAAATGSPWLAAFASSPHPPGTQASPWDALYQGAYSTFFEGASDFDSSLWTMRFEFTGSFIAFGLALACAGASRLLKSGLVAVALLLAGEADARYAAFVLGAGLAAFLPARTMPIPGWITAASLCLVLYLAGYMGHAAGHFGWLCRRLGHANPVCVHGMASGLAIILVESQPGLHRRLCGRLAGWLGRLSFPLYLLHIPVFCSLGCLVYLWVGPERALYAKTAAALTTLLATMALSLPLARFDVWWTWQVSRAAKRLSRDN